MNNRQAPQAVFLRAILSPDPQKRLFHQIIEGVFSFFLTLFYMTLAVLNTALSFDGVLRSIRAFMEILPDINSYAEIAAGFVVNAFDTIYSALGSLFAAPAQLAPLLYNIDEAPINAPGGSPNIIAMFQRPEGQLEPRLSSLLAGGMSFFQSKVAREAEQGGAVQNKRSFAPQ